MTRVIILVLLSINTQLFAQKPPLSAIYDYDHTRSFAGELLNSGLPYDVAYSTWIHTLYKSQDQSDQNLAEMLANDSLGTQALQKLLGSLEQRTKHTRMDSVRLQALSTALLRQEELKRKIKEKEQKSTQPSRPKPGKERPQGPSGKVLRRACRQSKTS